MPISFTEYLKGAAKRDAEEAKKRAAAETAEDERLEALGNLVEQHPIGRGPARHF